MAWYIEQIKLRFQALDFENIKRLQPYGKIQGRAWMFDQIRFHNFKFGSLINPKTWCNSFQCSLCPQCSEKKHIDVITWVSSYRRKCLYHPISCQEKQRNNHRCQSCHVGTLPHPQKAKAPKWRQGYRKLRREQVGIRYTKYPTTRHSSYPCTLS